MDLKVVDGTRSTVEGPSVRGRIFGPGEEGSGWKLPDAPNPGAFAPPGESRFVVGALVPCKLASSVRGLAVAPDAPLPGEQYVVVLPVLGVPTKTPISCSTEVRSAAFARTIAITGGSVGFGGLPVSDVRLRG